MMLESAAMVLVGYAGFAAWPWWVAPIIGAMAGLWNTFTKAKQLGVDFDDPSFRSDRGFELAAAAAPVTMLVSAVLFTGLYFLVAWIVR